MGQYFIIANPAKRQYLDINDFEENPKASGYMHGLHAAAVGILCCDPTEVRNGSGTPLYDFQPWAGAWRGDRVYAAGDDYGWPNDHGLQTTKPEQPERNLYWLAKQEFEDITEAVIVAMCESSDTFAELFVRGPSTPSPFRLIRFGDLALKHDCRNLRTALEQTFGSDWQQTLEEERKRRGR